MDVNDVVKEINSPGIKRIVSTALMKIGEGALCLNHWFLALLELHGPMAEDLSPGLNAEALKRNLAEKREHGQLGEPLDPQTAINKALAHARMRGKTQATEHDLAAVILTAAGYKLSNALDSGATMHTMGTPTLEKFGRNLTVEAQEGKLHAVTGRDNETQLIIETLCRCTKRNPALVGPAGVGKTAIIEGLAQRIVEQKIPNMLLGSIIWAVQPSVVAAGASAAGEFENRLRKIIEEASTNNVILFIDEMHSMVGAGGAEGTGDFASLIKPALARGDIACIAATTDNEYRQHIEADAALERRFQPVRIQQLTPKQTFTVLQVHRDELVKLRGVAVDDTILQWLIDFAEQHLHSRSFPDKAVDLLEQSVAHAVTENKQKVEHGDAETVARRMVGIPLDVNSSLTALRQHLIDTAFMTTATSDLLLNRLQVTMRGLEFRPARPNAVVLLAGAMLPFSEQLANTVAEALFGSSDRVVRIDLGELVNSEDIARLVGAPPSYVGYGDQVPLHRVKQIPWCVVLFRNIQACHPHIRDVITHALADGFVLDGQGKKIYLSDAVVLLAADIALNKHNLGFKDANESHDHAVRAAIVNELGEELVDQIDLIFTEAQHIEEQQRTRLKSDLLEELGVQYEKQGLRVTWDDSLIDWILKHHKDHLREIDWEHFVEDRIGPALIPILAQGCNDRVRSVIVKCVEDTITSEVDAV